MKWNKKKKIHHQKSSLAERNTRGIFYGTRVMDPTYSKILFYYMALEILFIFK